MSTLSEETIVKLENTIDKILVKGSETDEVKQSLENGSLKNM